MFMKTVRIDQSPMPFGLLHRRRVLFNTGGLGTYTDTVHVS